MTGKKVLIAYGTRYGSTRRTAEEIGAYLESKNVAVDYCDIRSKKTTPDFNSYDLIVVGGSVAIFHVLRKVKKFLKKLRDVKVPLVVFASAGMAIEEPEKAWNRFMQKHIDRYDLSPAVTQAIAPNLDFRPDVGLDAKTKNRIKGTIQAIAKEDYRENNVMDLRNKERFQNFLEQIGDIIA